MSNLTIIATDTGWHVEGVASYTPHTFTADLPECTCDPKRKGFQKTIPCKTRPFVTYRAGVRRDPVPGGYHVEHVTVFLKRVAATYTGKTNVPAVPIRKKASA